MAGRYALRMCLLVLASVALVGCKGKQFYFLHENDHRYYQGFATEIEYPDVEQPLALPATDTLPPRTLADQGPPEYWPLRLEEAIQMALANSRVMRDLGGR